MTTASLYRLHTDALDRRTLQAIADRILQTNPNQEVYIYDIERDEDEIGMLKDALHKRALKLGNKMMSIPIEKPHEPSCECGQCTGEDRAIEQMEKGIVDAETNYGDR